MLQKKLVPTDKIPHPEINIVSSIIAINLFNT